MAITIVANLIAALLDGFAIALLIPFLNILFHQPATTMPKGFVGNLLHTFVGGRIIPGDEMRSLRNVIILVMAAVVLKNLLVWIAGQFGAALQEYVTNIGLKLAKLSERPNLPWHFTVVDVPAINAFAIPGGYIYITRGILPFLADEAQLRGWVQRAFDYVAALPPKDRTKPRKKAR